MSMYKKSLAPLLTGVATGNAPALNAASQTPARPTPAPFRPMSKDVSYGVRQVEFDNSLLRQITLGIIGAKYPNVKHSGIGQSPAHTVWVSKTRLFCVTGFHTEAVNLDELSITAGSRGRAWLTSTHGNRIAIKPSGQAWRKFFENLRSAHPEIKIAPKVLALADCTDNTYEYFER